MKVYIIILFMSVWGRSWGQNFAHIPEASVESLLKDAFVFDFADYNRDGKLDWVTVKWDVESQSTYLVIYDVGQVGELEKLQVSLRSDLPFMYDKRDSIGHVEVLASVEIPSSANGVICTDFDYDGLIDVLVICSNSKYSPIITQNRSYIAQIFSASHSETPTKYALLGYIQEKQKLQLKFTTSTDPTNLFQDESETSDIYPFLADLNNDGRIDIVTQRDGLFVWLNTSSGLNKTPFSNFIHTNQLAANYQLTDQNDQKEDEKNDQNIKKNYEKDDGKLQKKELYPENLTIASPHSSAFVDIDGDCVADIVLEIQKGQTRQLAVFLNKLKNGYQFDRTLTLPRGSSQLTFADFNADGTIDIAFATCDQKNSCNGCCTGNDRIYMSPNTQKPMCKTGWFSKEQPPCRKVSELCTGAPYAFADFSESSSFAISNLRDSDDHFYGDIHHPVTLRAGDYDGNGFPDMLVLVTNRGSPSLQLMRNQPVEPSNSHLRKFVFQHELKMAINKETVYPYAAAFVDVFNRGALDVIGFGTLSNSSENAVAQTFIQSSDSDVLFLKATGLNGICIGSCTNGVPSSGPHSVNARGPTFKITVTDINGNKMPRVATQLNQSAHNPLSLPYVFFGLGRTNTYIEEFYFGVPNPANLASNMWISIIPNSQVLAIPYRLTKPKQWRLELSINPSKKFLNILLATGVTLLVVAGVILYLERREKAEDLEEHKGFRSHFIIN